jgi:hypothetical protein
VDFVDKLWDYYAWQKQAVLAFSVIPLVANFIVGLKLKDAEKSDELNFIV